MLNIKTFDFNPLHENTYLLWNEALDGVVVDPGCFTPAECNALFEYIGSEGVNLHAVLLTHAHFDHIYGVPAVIDKYGVPVFMHPDDKSQLAASWRIASALGFPDVDAKFETINLSDGQIVKFGELEFEVIHTPGHTPGCVCFHDMVNGVIATGDTLFAGSIGRTDMEGGDYDKIIVSIMDRLMHLPSDTDILPGHGPKSDIGTERTHNPFLQPFNEKDDDIDWDSDGLVIDPDLGI